MTGGAADGRPQEEVTVGKRHRDLRATLRHADAWGPRSALALLGKHSQPPRLQSLAWHSAHHHPPHTRVWRLGQAVPRINSPLLLRRGLRKKFMTLTFLSPHKTRFVSRWRKTASYKGRCGHTLSSKPQPHTPASCLTQGRQVSRMSSGDRAPGSLRQTPGNNGCI